MLLNKILKNRLTSYFTYDRMGQLERRIIMWDTGLELKPLYPKCFEKQYICPHCNRGMSKGGGKCDKCDGTGIAIKMTENDGCAKADYEKNTCTVYFDPSAKWHRSSGCPMATNILTLEEKKKMLNPLKYSKRKSRGR